MARRATGEIRYTKDGPVAVVTIRGKRRKAIKLSGCRTRAEVPERSALVAGWAKRFRDAGIVETDDALQTLTMLGGARGAMLKGWLTAAEELVSGELVDVGAPDAPTFEEVAKTWTSGKLHAEYPDHVKAKKDADDDRERLKFICEIDFVGQKVGDIPVDAFTLDHAEHVMRNLPEAVTRPATRRHYAQLVHRVLALAVYPMRLIDVHPLPKGFMPKAGSPPLFPYIYPSEEAALLARRKVPIELRMAHGFSVREGVRVSELAALTVHDFELRETNDGCVRGTVTLDENKTDDPRSWALRPDTAAALKAWFELRKAEAKDRAFPAENGSHFEMRALADRIRAALEQAGVKRRALHHNGTNTRRYRFHDARGSFITIASANGRSEAWIADRTGHQSSAMINRYRKRAREAAELELGDWRPLDQSVPELADCHSIATGVSACGSDSAEGTTNQSLFDASSEDRTRTDTPSLVADFESQLAGPNRQEMPQNQVIDVPHRAPSSAESGNRLGSEAPSDAVESALADALTKAAAAGQWDVVEALTAELQARRRARGQVVELDTERKRRGLG